MLDGLRLNILLILVLRMGHCNGCLLIVWSGACELLIMAVSVHKLMVKLVLESNNCGWLVLLVSRNLTKLSVEVFPGTSRD